MKHLFVLILITSLSHNVFLQNTGYSASLNKLLDEITTNIKNNGKEIDIEPLKIEDVHEKNNENEYDLTDGVVSNVISVERFGDAVASYESGILKVKTGFKFTNLQAYFNFKAKAYGLNPEGNVTALIPNLAATVELTVDALNTLAKIDELLIPSVGDIQVDVKTTVPIYEDILNILIAVFTGLFQDEIIYLIGKAMQEKVNVFIHDILIA